MAETHGGGVFRIGELAIRSSLTPDTIRYYERLGLLPRAARTEGGFRLYTDETVERLRFIAQAKAFDLSLEDIKELSGFDGRGGLRRCRQMRDLLAGKLGKIEHRLRELVELQATLTRSLRRCDKALGVAAAHDCPVIEDLNTSGVRRDQRTRRPVRRRR